MKWSFASVGVIVMGLFGLLIIILFNEITVSNEQDYYNLKDATEAAMYEAVDVSYYRLSGEIKISQEKFVENFTRRFTETSTFGQGNYSIVFNDISEIPAKVSLQIIDSTNSYNIYNSFNGGTVDIDATQINIVNELSAILESPSDDKCTDPNSPCTVSIDLISWAYESTTKAKKESNWTINTRDLNFNNTQVIDGIKGNKTVMAKLVRVDYLGQGKTKNDLIERHKNQCLWYNGYTGYNSSSNSSSFWKNNGTICSHKYEENDQCVETTYTRDPKKLEIINTETKNTTGCEDYDKRAACIVKIDKANFMLQGQPNYSQYYSIRDGEITKASPAAHDIKVSVNYSTNELSGCSRYELVTKYRVTWEYYIK